MARLLKASTTCTFWALIVCLFIFNDAQDAPDPPELSALAIKMKGVCSKLKLDDDYITNCTKSAISILPDPEDYIFLAKLSVNSILKLLKQNKLIMTALINRALHNYKVPHHQPRFGFELVSTTFAMYGTICPIVPPLFLQTVYHLFSYINWKTAHNRKELLSKQHQKWIFKLLHECSIGLKPTKTFTDTCKETVLTVQNCTSFICTEAEHEFRLMRTDPILDVVFKTMEMIQAVCFPYFTESYRLFHFYHLAVMDTFTEEMKTRWTTQLEDISFWKRLLGPSFEIHLINMERCNQATIPDVKFRIPRNSLPARIRLAGRFIKL